MWPRLRPATNADGEQIANLVCTVLGEHGLQPDPQRTDADLQDIEHSYLKCGGAFYVLEKEDGAIIGSYGLYPTQPGTCELRRMYLHRDYRGQGHGRQMLDDALAKARQLGFRQVTLDTASAAQEAIRLEMSETHEEAVGDQVKNARMHAVLVLLGITGALLAFACAWRYGTGTSPDSASYLAAARNLLSGAGYRDFNGDVYTQGPPLFPTLLALPGLVGVEPLTAARFLNGLSFGLIVFLSGALFLRCTRSRVFTLLGTLSILISPALLEASVMVWSEPVFLVLMSLFLLALPKLVRDGSPSWLLIVALLAGLACLQRYVGVALILTGSVLIVLGMSGASVRRRVAYLAVFCLVSAGPLVGWFARNTFVVGHRAGSHPRHGLLGPEARWTLDSALDVMAAWFFPRSFSHSFRLVGAGLVLGLTLVLILSLWRRAAERSSPRTTQIACIVVCGLLSFGFLVVAGAGWSWNPDPRLMTPLYLLVMVPVFAGIEEVGRMARERLGGGNLAGVLGLAVCVLGLVHPLETTVNRVRGYTRHGLRDFGAAVWRQSPLVDWLRRHPLEGTIYSNIPEALYLLAGRPAQTTPAWNEDPTKFTEAMSPASASYIVWSYIVRRNFLYDLRELASRWRMEEVASCPDGKVYRFLGPGGPGVSAVYRFWSPQQGRHSYTADKREREDLVLNHAREWTYEGPAFYAFADQQSGTIGVHGFQSTLPRIRFYTTNEQEKDRLIGDDAGRWAYRGVLFYVYPQQPSEDLRPVYRLWSTRLGYHFYGISTAEKEKLLKEGGWLDEGVAWYAYGP